MFQHTTNVLFRFDLIPWDAGTDSGVTYMAVNSPTVPHKPIRNLTSSDHPNSPFFDPSGRPIPPVARIVIRRISLEVKIRLYYFEVCLYCFYLLSSYLS